MSLQVEIEKKLNDKCCLFLLIPKENRESPESSVRPAVARA